MRIQAIEEILAEHPDFRQFDAATIALLAGCARMESFAAGAPIFREGEPAGTAWLVRRGDVAIEIAAPGRAPLIVETRHPGDLLGWSWIVPPYRRMSDARAIGDVGAIGLDAACLRAKLDEHPEIGYRMLKTWLPQLALRARAQRVQLLDLYGRDT